MHRGNGKQDDILYRCKNSVDLCRVTHYHRDIYSARDTLSISKALIKMFLILKLGAHMGGKVGHWVCFDDEELPQNV